MKTTRKLNLLAAALVGVLAMSGLVRAQTAGKKPNVVYLLVDNLGMGELSVYSGAKLRSRIPSLVE
jgi:hypothetical protein